MKNCIASFEATYDKLLASKKDGREPTPADLYNLDKYWQMQAQLREELQKLGETEIALLSENFEETWEDVYNSVAYKSQPSFSEIDKSQVQQMINSVWCADGKTWSQRVWDNTEKLAETLNEELINCVVTGKKTSDLKKLLQERFSVSYNQAETLVRTEIAHIQVQAAAENYMEHGLDEYEFFADTDEKTCPICGKLDGKKFKYSEMKIGKNAPPLHPKCRCDILPVIKDKDVTLNTEKKEKKPKKGYKKCANCGTEFKPKNGSKVCDVCREKILSDKDSVFLISRGADREEVIKFMMEEIEEISAGGLYERWLKQNPKNSLEALGYKQRLEKNLWDEELGERVTDWVWYKPNLSFPYDMFNPEELFYACVDCGKVFLRNSNSQVRCDECNALWRKKYKAQKERERRLRKKLEKIK